MKITNVKITKLSGEEKCKALASFTIEESFVITGIRIMEGSNGLFCAMPSRKTANNEYKDICFPVTADARKYIIDTILNEYNKTNDPVANDFIPDDDELPF